MIWIIAELAVLYILSRELSKRIYQVVYLVSLSKHLPITILSLLFFPGTTIHELSHWIVAELARVPTGEIVLHPIVEHEGSVRMGSVAIGETDPFRRLLVGVAPLLVGMLGLLTITQVWLEPLVQKNIPVIGVSTISSTLSGIAALGTQWMFYLCLYVLFVIGNTMFSSKRDLEGFWVVGAILGFLALWLYALKVQVNLSFENTILVRIQNNLLISLSSILIMDSLLLVFLFSLKRLFQKLLKRKIVYKKQE